MPASEVAHHRVGLLLAVQGDNSLLLELPDSAFRRPTRPGSKGAQWASGRLGGKRGNASQV